ncbi:uncharacterized protein PgNI_01869 [Pyricularia grisea]|uniref:Uncharacterized protein n=1 Tax=Pyricularia grisea TaxID=148305 RepID=A0A6P8BM50_PYRGI|nr:uncharacterized protein PgNI_01869 [Pyricularia grisea]TLD17715.1 hypothetical protein PgNI_01869 [Pyricularia grisea]
MAISLEDLIKDNKERYPKEHVYNFDFFHNYIQYLVNAATEEVTMNMPLNFKPLFRLDNKAVDVAEMIPIPIGIIRGAWSVDPDKDVALYWTNPKFKPSTPVSPIFREIASSFGAKFAGSGGPSKAAPRH